MHFAKRLYLVAPLIVASALLACTVPMGTPSETADPPPGSAGTSPERSASGATETPSPDITDPTALIDCRQVPRELCIDYAREMIRGPQPEYAGEIQRVLVTCERLPPCGPDRPDSGGKIMILYTNGWAWTQDWVLSSGT
jgi:hypothetical protein